MEETQLYKIEVRKYEHNPFCEYRWNLYWYGLIDYDKRHEFGIFVETDYFLASAPDMGFLTDQGNLFFLNINPMVWNEKLPI